MWTSEMVRELCLHVRNTSREAVERSTNRVLVAQGSITLPIALRDLNSPVDIINECGVVGDVLYAARATAALKIGR